MTCTRTVTIIRPPWGYRALYALAGLILSLVLAAAPCAAETAPGFLLAAGSAEPSGYVIVVEKDLQQLSLWCCGENLAQMLRMKCSTGERRGRKLLAGDRKTPEGIYFFTRHFKAAVLAPRYGTRAFPLNYPNCFDRRSGRRGYSIWLHGTNRPLQQRNSNGCIVLANADIDRLAANITLNRTPLVIVKRIHYVSSRQKERQTRAVLAFLHEWNTALTHSASNGFRKLYDRICTSGLNWLPDWEILAKRFDAAGVSYHTSFAMPAVYHYGQDYVIEFVQHLVVAGKIKQVGTRRLCISQNGEAFRVLGDRFIVQAKRKHAMAENPLVKVARESLLQTRLGFAQK